MFWKFGGYANISPVDTILDRPDFTLEDLLDENDLLGDIKTRNNKLLEYLRQRDVLERLLDYVVAPKVEKDVAPDTDSSDSTDANSDRGRPHLAPFGRPRASSSTTDSSSRDEEDEAEKLRNKFAFVSCEILASDNWTICDMLMDPSNRDLLHKFWQFLRRPVPLDPLQASYFTKVNESLFDRKVVDMVDFVKSTDNAVQNMIRHVDSPMIMDLLLKIITLDRPDRPEGGQGIVEWLYSQDLMPTLLSFLSPRNSWATQTSAGDFIKAIITVSANATQNEQTCIGPNELTRQLVSHPCIDELIGYMLGGGNALTVGVGIVIEVIRKNNSDYDPDVGTEANSIPSGRDPIYLGTLLRKFAENVPNFMQLMANAPAQKLRLTSTFSDKIEPLGFDRFKTCELMAELLHCSNMGLLNEVGSEELIAARDAERKRLRVEGRLGRNRGEEVELPSADLLTMKTHSVPPPPSEGRRLEVTNVSAADEEDGFEEVTHAAGLGEGDEEKQSVDRAGDVESPSSSGPDSSAAAASQSFLEKDEDDFVEEPLSSPRLHTRDDAFPNGIAVFDDPDLVVAPLSPNKTKTLSPTNEASSFTAAEASTAAAPADGELLSSKEDVGGDFVTEATEPALGEEAKKMLSDSDKGDDSESSIVFTPTISRLSDPIEAESPQRPPSPTPAEQDGSLDKADEGKPEEAAQEPTVLPAVPEVAPLSIRHKTDAAAAVPAESSAEVTEGTPEVAPEGVPEASPEVAPLAIPESAAPADQPTEEQTAYDKADPDATQASVVVADKSAVEPSIDAAREARFIDPVVGDFLKMQFVDYRVVPTILSFFFTYPWNNFLHNVVYDVVQQVFNGPMDRGFNPHLAISLFESADITTQIINGQLTSEQSQAASRTRMGYMGHLTLIAEEVVKFTERHPPELLSEVVLDKVMSQDWINYVEGPLAETRERDNAILGGLRPDMAMGNQAAAAGLTAVGLSGLGSSLGLSNNQGTSSALADAGLSGDLDFQGGNDGGLGPFSISAGISSGFHSSSDEEDDDTDDNDEDVNNEFRAYTDPLNASSSMLPPVIPPPPPPPPPLNIPPSRARLQLAARLAMNKRNAEAAAAQEDAEDAEVGVDTDMLAGMGAGTTTTGTKSLSGMWQSGSGPERLRNPFADDEDDDEEADEEDDDDDELGLGSGEAGDGSGRVGLGWNRGSWWRSMVRRDRKRGSGGSGGSLGSAGSMGSGGSAGFGLENEKFGDGRDSSSSGDEEEDGNPGDRGDRGDRGVAKAGAVEGQIVVGSGDGADNNDEDDEEFGDFAMPEVSKEEDVEGSAAAAADATGNGLPLDRDSEPVIFKPLAVHPTAAAASSSSSSQGGSSGTSGSTPGTGGSGLWLERLGFLTAGSNTNNASTATTTATAEASKSDEPVMPAVPDAPPAPAAPAFFAAAVGQHTTTVVTPAAKGADDELEVLSEDGHKVSCVTEATRRTSLEDPDEEVVV